MLKYGNLHKNKAVFWFSPQIDIFTRKGKIITYRFMYFTEIYGNTKTKENYHEVHNVS